MAAPRADGHAERRVRPELTGGHLVAFRFGACGTLQGLGQLCARFVGGGFHGGGSA